MSKNSTDWAQPGTEVVEVTYGMGGHWYGNRGRIGKVYKNGNFVLEGSTDQWSPSRDGTAMRTNRTGYRGKYLTLVTDEVKGAMEAAQKMREAKAILQEWEKIIVSAQRSNEPDRAISLAAKLGPAPEPSA